MNPRTFDVKTSSLMQLAISNILQITPSEVKVRRVSQSFSTVVTYEMPEAKAIQLWWLVAKNSSLLINEKIKAVQIESGPMLWLYEQQSDQHGAKSIGEGQCDAVIYLTSVGSVNFICLQK